MVYICTIKIQIIISEMGKSLDQQSAEKRINKKPFRILRKIWVSLLLWGRKSNHSLDAVGVISYLDISPYEEHNDRIEQCIRTVRAVQRECRLRSRSNKPARKYYPSRYLC